MPARRGSAERQKRKRRAVVRRDFVGCPVADIRLREEGPAAVGRRAQMRGCTDERNRGGVVRPGISLNDDRAVVVEPVVGIEGVDGVLVDTVDDKGACKRKIAGAGVGRCPDMQEP